MSSRLNVLNYDSETSSFIPSEATVGKRERVLPRALPLFNFDLNKILFDFRMCMCCFMSPFIKCSYLA